jgi:broad specificity phosphatase PhoE
VSEPSLTLVRHGQTEWSENGRHTSVTDLALLPAGRQRAEGLRGALDPADFVLVLSSPRIRALQTARLAGFGTVVSVTEDLAEWAYGDYEGLTTEQILAQRPDWDLWRDGCPGGESPQQVTERVDRVIERGVSAGGAVIMFAHGHILRSLAARWLGEEVAFGKRLVLSPATISVLGTEHSIRALEGWNETGHQSAVPSSL